MSDAGSAVIATRAPARRAVPLRAQIVAAAVDLTATSGWSAVTMGRLAEAVGVSRQTVYTEVGTKPALAEAMVLDELARFLAVVELAFDDHPHDLPGAMRSAVHGVLGHAQESVLLRAIVSGAHGANTELLPPLTTRAGSLMAAATAVLATRLAAYDLVLAPRERDAAVDIIVRVVLSHVMQPGDTPASAADDLAGAALRLLGSPA